MQQALARISPQLPDVAIGIATHYVAGFLAQIAIYAIYGIFRSSDITVAAIVTSISTVLVLLFLIWGLWKKHYAFSLGILFGYLMQLALNFPFLIASTS